MMRRRDAFLFSNHSYEKSVYDFLYTCLKLLIYMYIRSHRRLKRIENRSKCWLLFLFFLFFIIPSAFHMTPQMSRQPGSCLLFGQTYLLGPIVLLNTVDGDLWSSSSSEDDDVSTPLWFCPKWLFTPAWFLKILPRGAWNSSFLTQRQTDRQTHTHTHTGRDGDPPLG